MTYIKEIVRYILLKSKIFFFIVNRFNHSLVKLKISGLYDYCEKNNGILEYVDERTVRKGRKVFMTKKDFEHANNTGYTDYQFAKSYIALIKRTTIYAQTDGVEVDNLFLTDRYTWDKKGVAAFRSNAMLAIDSEKCIMRFKKEENILCGIYLGKMWSENIFHFTFESIGRIETVDKYSEYWEWPLLIDEAVSEDNRSVELIGRINIHRHPIIWLKKDGRYFVENVIIPPCYVWGTADPRIKKKPPIIIDENIVRYLRKCVLQNNRFNGSGGRKVFVERGNNKRLINEDEIKKVFKENGFEIFNPDKGNLQDEIDCFSTADVIVGCCGAAFTNIIYCKKSVLIFQICPYEFQESTCLPMADATGIKNVNIVVGILVKKGKTMNTSQFMLPIEKSYEIIEQSLKHIEKNIY